MSKMALGDRNIFGALKSSTEGGTPRSDDQIGGEDVTFHVLPAAHFYSRWKSLNTNKNKTESVKDIRTKKS